MDKEQGGFKETRERPPFLDKAEQRKKYLSER